MTAARLILLAIPALLALAFLAAIVLQTVGSIGCDGSEKGFCVHEGG